MANVVAAPLAASLLLLDGKNGMHGWQWCVRLGPAGLIEQGWVGLGHGRWLGRRAGGVQLEWECVHTVTRS
jgi:hypothetical protein